MSISSIMTTAPADVETTAPLLRLDALDVTYRSPRGDVAAVRDVSLRVHRGETVAIVGESGSGKSTLVARLLGLLAHDVSVRQDGYVLQGEDVTGHTDRAWSRIRGRRVGFIPQDPAGSLDPVQSIGAQVKEALALNGVPRAARAARAVELLRTAGIEEPERYLPLYPHQLSGGTCQRVLIAIAIAGDPELIIADEPTSALDVTTQRHVLDHLGDLVRRSGSALILITHDLGVALDRSDRIVVMQHGRIVEAGETLEVFREPREDYTRRLVRAMPSLSAPRARPAARDRAGSAAGERSIAPVIEVSGLRKVFEGRGGSTVAVSGADFALERGATLAVVGQSGSGKSTLARLVLGLETPSAGTVRLRSHTGDELDPHRLGRGGRKRLSRLAQLVYQNPYASLHPLFRIGDIVAEPLRAHGVAPTADDLRHRVSQLLTGVGLDAGFADRLPRELSGGQRQRVAIARALALDPEILVLDEPVSALDVSVQGQILELLIGLQAERALGYLFISHDLAVVRQISDEVIVMHRGEFVETGPTSGVLSDPQHPYTQSLLEASPGRRGLDSLPSDGRDGRFASAY